jgi:uncharacterized membrane protein
MNIHPIFVHFPIALLTIYAMMELLRFKTLKELPYFFYSKAMILIIGALSSSVALQTGEMAQHALGSPELRSLVNMHAWFAGFASYVFAVLAIVYAVSWVNKSEFAKKILSKITSINIVNKLWILVSKISEKIIANDLLMIVLAIVGLVTITITGALGGAIVYGPGVDPIVQFVYNLVM